MSVDPNDLCDRCDHSARVHDGKCLINTCHCENFRPAPKYTMTPILPIGPGGRWVTMRSRGTSRTRRVPISRPREKNPIDENYRRAREITAKMPPAILGVFAPDEMPELEKLREEFVNTYRHAWGSNRHVWGSNAGLSTERINSMSRKELEESIRSLKRLIEANERRTLAKKDSLLYEQSEEPGFRTDKDGFF